MSDLLPGQPLPASALRRIAEPPACSVHGTNAQSAPPGVTHTWLDAPGVNYDTHGMHDAENPSRITVEEPGIYLFAATVAFAANSTGSYRLVALRINGSGAINLNTVGPAGASVATVITCLRTFVLAEGDYLEVGARHDAASALNVDLREFNVILIARSP